MWILKLSLTTLWLAGMVMGWTLGGALHLLAFGVVALVSLEGSAIERRMKRIGLRFLHQHGWHRTAPRAANLAVR